MKTALVSNIQKFSLDDGPGIRTTVFFKGCNLSCAWCHNPECISRFPTLQFTADACNVCGHCQVLCPHGVHFFKEKSISCNVIYVRLAAHAARAAFPMRLH